MAGAFKTPIEIKDIKSNELYGVLLKARGEAGPYSDESIAEELRAAEDFYEHDLKIAFGSHRVFSAPEARLTISGPLSLAALDPPYDPVVDIAEPPYDYEQNQFAGNRWGLIKFRHKPALSITRVLVAWTADTPLWDIPQSWIRPDLKAGTLSIVPFTGNVVTMTLATYMIGTVAAGRGMPHAIYVDYTYGITTADLLANHRDLLKGIRLRALLGMGGMLTSVSTPGGTTGGSLSLDGLSRSQNFGGKFGAYSGKITLAMQQEEEIRTMWGKRVKGPAVAFA